MWAAVSIIVLTLSLWQVFAVRISPGVDWQYLGRYQRTDWYVSETTEHVSISRGKIVSSPDGAIHSLQVPIPLGSLTLGLLVVLRLVWWLLTLDTLRNHPHPTVMFMPLIELYWPSIFLAPTHDDYFHLMISAAHSWPQLIGFFDLSPVHEFAHYRPVGTQLFYWVAHLTNTIWILRIIQLGVFAKTAQVLIATLKLLGWKSRPSAQATFLWMLLAAHAGKLWFLGAFQEVAMLLCVSMTLYAWTKYLVTTKRSWIFVGLLWLMCGLLSKELALTTPLLAVTLWITSDKKLLTKSKLIMLAVPTLVVLAIYLYLRLVRYGITSTDTYVFDFSPSSLLNTLLWYGLWLLGVPESFVDFIGSGFRPLASYYTVLKPYSLLVPMALSATLIAGTQRVLAMRKEMRLRLLIFASWCVIALTPVWFLPNHKFAFALSMASVGILLMFALLLSHTRSRFFVTLVLLLQLTTHVFVAERHWVINGSAVAARTRTYLMPKMSDAVTTIELVDTSSTFSQEWGSTRQIELALSEEDALTWWFQRPLTVESTRSASLQDPSRVSVPSLAILGY